MATPTPTESYMMDITLKQLEDNSIELTMGYPASVKDSHITNPDPEQRAYYNVNEDAPYANDFWVMQYAIHNRNNTSI